MSIDQTGFGYASAGWAPLDIQRQDARRNKFHSERMSDAMQFIDPYIKQAVDSAVRTQVQNGNNLAEVRRAAFGSVSGQIMRDTFGAMRQTGYMGQGNHINYGANIMQGVAGGGFSMNLLSPQGRTVGMGQQINGNGALSEKVAIQMAKDVMTNLYGAGTPDPARLYGFNMEESSGIFNTLAQRGALGNVGVFKRYGKGQGVAEKLANARRQEVDPMILAGLDGVTEGNIDARIAKATKEGDKKVATALGDIKSSESGVIVDDRNTKRVTEITKEVIKGLANLKDVYGELNSPQLLAQMEALSGIKITNEAEARRAATLTNNLRNAAEASGYDPRAVMDAMSSPGAVMAGQQRWAQHLGLDGRNDDTINQIRAGFASASATQGMGLSRNLGNLATRINAGGGNVRAQSNQSIQLDTDQMVDAMVRQDPAMIYGSGLARGQFQGDREFGIGQREIEEEYANARNGEGRSAAAHKMRRLMQSRGITFDAAYRASRQGQNAVADADYTRLTDVAISQGNVAASTPVARRALQGMGSSEDALATERILKSGLGVGGMQALKDINLQRDGDSQISALLDSHVKNGEISEQDAATLRRTILGKDGRLKDTAAFTGVLDDIGNSRAGGRSNYERNRMKQQQMDAANMDQRSKLTDGEGQLNVKSIINSLATGKSAGLDTDTQKLAAIEAMQAEGMAGGIAKVGTVDTRDGFSQGDMDAIRRASGNDKFNVHTKLGYASEQAMIAASSSASVRQRIMTELQNSGELMLGGDSGALKISAAKDRDKIEEQARRFGMSSRLRDMSGLKPGEISAAMKQLLETGKVAAGSQLPGTDDGGASLYDGNKGTNSLSGYLFGSKDRNTAHLSQAGGFARLAADTLGDGFATSKALNEATGGGLVTQMERELKTLKSTLASGAVTIDTNDGKGGTTKMDLAAVVKSVEEAISKLKESSDTKVIEEMTVRVLKIDGVEPRN